MKYRIVKDTLRAKKIADSEYYGEGYNYVLRKIYFAEKYIPAECRYILSGKWEEIGSFETVREAKIFFDWIKKTQEKIDVVYEDEF